MTKQFEWEESDLHDEDKLAAIADASASRAITKVKNRRVVRHKKPQPQKPRRVVHRPPQVRGTRTFLGMSQYGDCGFHSFYAVGEDKARCCAESSCDFDIDRHRKPYESPIDTTDTVVSQTESRKVKGMAHNFQIKVVPHVNKDGSESATKKDYQVWDRTRRGRVLVGVRYTRKSAETLIEDARSDAHLAHANNHPNDRHFTNKHVKENNNV